MTAAPELYESITALHALLTGKGPFLLVRDPTAWELSGAKAALEADLSELGAVPFEEQAPHPTLETMRAAATRADQAGCRAIVAIGGGTASDTAKGAAWCLAGGAVFEAPPVESSLLPLLAVPTTAGTGSEATHFAVCWHEGEKHSLADPRLLPAHAVVDADLHQSLPPHLTATTGLDALCQSLESLWAKGATDASRANASEAAQLILSSLEDAVTQPTPLARRAMANGAHLAGRAINVSKTTTPHALSYALTNDHGVPHGFAVALTLRACMELRHRCEKLPAGTEHVTSLLGSSLDEASARFGYLLEACGAPKRIRDVGVLKADLEPVAARVNPERLANDSWGPSAEDLREVLRLSW